MWILENNQLPTTAIEPSYAPLCVLETGDYLAPLCKIDFQANYRLPGTYQSSLPTTIVGITNDQNTVSIGDLIQVDAIGIGTTTYMPAKDPENPQPGEFVRVGNVAVLAPRRPIMPGLPVRVIGGVETTPTDYVDPTILEVFYGLPVKASLSWSLSVENHPSGTITLEAIGDANCAIVDEAFKKGSLLTFAGIGFSVGGYTKKLRNTHFEPARVWDISVSLAGKWEAKPFQNPAFLIPALNLPIADGVPYTDPRCQIFGTVEAYKASRATRITVGELASRVGAKFVGFSSSGAQAAVFNRVGLKPFPAVAQRFGTVYIPLTRSLDVWSVPIASGLARGATGTWQETLDELKRLNGCYVDYTKPDAIYARDIESGNRWAYSVPEIDIAYKGDTSNSPTVEGYGIEYQAAKLAGSFSEPAGQNGETTQGRNDAQVNWKRRNPVMKTLISGATNPFDPPANFPVIRNMSANWDVSGTTAEWIKVTTQDGVEILRERKLYGAAFTSSDVTRIVGDQQTPVFALTTSFWQVVQHEMTETRFDPDTRYITGSKTGGTRKGRYKQETDDLELLGVEGTDRQSQYEASLYRFDDYPIYAVEQVRLVQLASHYKDVQREPVPVELVRRCLPDGTSALVPVRDPNFVEPMYVEASLSFSTSFSHTKNPDSTPDNPKPDLIQGEEKLSQQSIYIQPSKATETLVFGNLDNSQNAKTDDDLYVQYESEVASQNSGFGNYTAKSTFTANNGRPSGAQRLPDIYEKEQPEQDSGHPDIFKDPREAEYDYVLCTPGSDPNDPSTTTLSYANANYLHQGLTAALSELKVQDIQSSMEYGATIATNFAIRPMDYVQLDDGGKVHRTRVISVENTILLQGDIDGYPLAVAPQNTQIKCGIDRDIPVSITRRPTPKAYDVLGASRVFGLAIGEIIPPSLQGRGNY